MKSRIRVILLVLLALAIAGYIAQVPTPLRINTDAYRLLSMAASYVDEGDFLVEGQKDQFGPGYPLVISLLMRCGLGNSHGLVALNVFSILGGATCYYVVLRRSSGHAGLVLVLSLYSWVSIKHATLPVTESLYVGISGMVIFLLEQGRHSKEINRAIVWYLAGLIGIVAAVSVRTIGVTLLPAAAVAALERFQSVDRRMQTGLGRVPWTSGTDFRARRILFAVAVLAFCTIGAIGLNALLASGWLYTQLVLPQGYFQSMLRRIGSPTVVFTNVKERLLEWADVMLNLPGQQLFAQFPGMEIVLFAAGGVFILFAYANALRKRQANRVLCVYFCAYSTVLLVWPYYDSRFWLPVLPLMLYYSIDDPPFCPEKYLKWARSCYAVFFLAFGVVAFAFSTSLTYSGNQFPDQFGRGSQRAEYRYAQKGRQPDDEKVDLRKGEIIRRFW